ncbi:MAG TPA: isocitrate lyase/phosphoenolpyruvate mutase family protein [Devosiaceae bacterium]|jgi:2-methylisocitrate lyase-like PEP mutase family enzyme|nr:isocitrate lyase/phosphoenolpyruvate mutase family protein [Devosiaceae bacterium]
MDQFEKGARLRALHERGKLFVIPNPWDAGSARLLAGMGFEALATTSAGLAFGLGVVDGVGLVSRQQCLDNAALIAAATELPVSADLENGYGDRPEDAAECIRLAAAAGVVGGSIEDATGRPDAPIYDFALAVERVAAAAEAAHALPFPFSFVARAENYLHGVRDLDDTIRRLQAFEKAGADVLFAPGLPDLEAIRTVCASVDKPVNVVAGAGGVAFPLAELEAAGVRRVSTGSTLARAALTGLRDAAAEIGGSGSFGFLDGLVTGAEVAAVMRAR